LPPPCPRPSPVQTEHPRFSTDRGSVHRPTVSDENGPAPPRRRTPWQPVVPTENAPAYHAVELGVFSVIGKVPGDVSCLLQFRVCVRFMVRGGGLGSTVANYLPSAYKTLQEGQPVRPVPFLGSLEGRGMRQSAMPTYHLLVANWRTARHFAWGPASRCHATWASVEHLGTCHPHCTRICSPHTTGDTKNKPGTTKRSACGTKQGT
jgi:hypothetical protein